MNLNQSLNLNQSQKLAITTSLKQSLNILGMSKQDLEDEIIKQGEENPLIEVEKNNDIDWESYVNYLYKSSYKFNENYIDNNYVNYENIISSYKSIYDELQFQISLYKLNNQERKVCEFIIDSLDEDGYLKIEEKEIIKRLNISKELFNECLKKVQQLEPSGVGARNLSECLIIQIRNKKIKDLKLEEILRNDLDKIGNNKYKDISKKYSISIEKCLEYIQIIKTLNPKPGKNYNIGKSTYIQPDVIVEKLQGEFVLSLNDRDIPKIKINKFYKEILFKSQSDEYAKKFIKENLNSALELIKSIENRKSTILKISKEIVKSQEDFFEKGPKYIKAMKMKDIAVKLNCHESTISRGVNGKYILTPFGIFELKYFFSTSINTNDNKIISNRNIKNTIVKMIKKENKSNPLSDEKIVEKLKENGVSIARRTVAKYRSELNIPSSSKRKQHFIVKK